MTDKPMRAKYLRNDGDRQPEEISAIIGTVIEHASVGVDIRHGDLVSRWAEIVPADWRFGTPVGVRDHTLLVTVPDGATASLLRYQTSAAMAAIDREYGQGFVRSIRLSVDRHSDRESQAK